MNEHINSQAEAQNQLTKRLETLIQCISDFGFGRGQVLLALIEANFIEYGKTVLTSAAQQISDADAELCLSRLRREIMPEIIRSVLPGAPAPSALDGLWEQHLERAYAAACKQPAYGEGVDMDVIAFRNQYIFRLRRERFRNAFRQKLEAALTAAIREVGREVRQRLSPSISEIRAQARQRRRRQVSSEQHIFSDARLFHREWDNHLGEICLAFEARIPVPQAWRTRKNITTWTEVAELIETDRALRSRVHKYIRRRLSGLRATAAAERGEKVG